MSEQNVDTGDFDLAGADGESLVAVQVKSAKAERVLYARTAVSILVRLVVNYDSRRYRLITSAVPHGDCLKLVQALREHRNDPSGLREAFEALLVRAEKVRGMCRALSDEQWRRLCSAEIEIDIRDEAQVREDLNGALRRERARASPGLSMRSGGFLVGYLVSEVLRRAADPSQARWDAASFACNISMTDSELIAIAGSADFGLVLGRIPKIPERGRRWLSAPLVEDCERRPVHDLPVRRQDLSPQWSDFPTFATLASPRNGRVRHRRPLGHRPTVARDRPRDP